MNNADVQILRAIQKGPSGAAVVALAGILEQLGQELDAVREQATRHGIQLRKLDNAVETLIEEQEPERDPVPYMDYLPDLSVLDAPAVAYARDDPNAPKGGTDARRS